MKNTFFIMFVISMILFGCVQDKMGRGFSITNSFGSGKRVIKYIDGYKIREAAVNTNNQEYIVIEYNRDGEIVYSKEYIEYWPEGVSPNEF